MKRKIYEVTCDNTELLVINHTWNAARKSIVSYMRTRANLHECTFNEVKSKCDRDSNGKLLATNGIFEWSNGHIQFVFRIKLVD